MAKRFTDTDKWKHPSYRKLPAEGKLAWIYLLDNCDHAGMWLIDYELMTFQLGFEVNETKLAEWLGDKLYPIGSNRILIPGYLEFQYGKTLDKGSRSHASAQKILFDYGVSLDALPEPLSSCIQGAKKVHARRPRPATNTISIPTPNTNTEGGSGGKPTFDFEAVYRKYPRKEKKTPGIARCRALIKTQADYDLLHQAVENYTRNKSGTETKFLMQFSTFMSEWRDWLSPETGTSAAKKSLAQEWLEESERGA